jgi:hypothetical protein
MSFSAEEQQNTLEIIVSQLKSYGFYSLAKGISDKADQTSKLNFQINCSNL